MEMVVFAGKLHTSARAEYGSDGFRDRVDGAEENSSTHLYRHRPRALFSTPKKVQSHYFSQRCILSSIEQRAKAGRREVTACPTSLCDESDDEEKSLPVSQAYATSLTMREVTACLTSLCDESDDEEKSLPVHKLMRRV
ncbi:hypothetical protein F2P79_024211 [Pimephales promelas]|nr:hypothetical protein F2P79_024211 [Pimephales promelas]